MAQEGLPLGFGVGAQVVDVVEVLGAAGTFDHGVGEDAFSAAAGAGDGRQVVDELGHLATAAGRGPDVFLRGIAAGVGQALRPTT